MCGGCLLAHPSAPSRSSVGAWPTRGTTSSASTAAGWTTRALPRRATSCRKSFAPSARAAPGLGRWSWSASRRAVRSRSTPALRSAMRWPASSPWLRRCRIRIWSALPARARREFSWATAASTVASRTRWASRATGCLPRGATTGVALVLVRTRCRAEGDVRPARVAAGRRAGRVGARAAGTGAAGRPRGRLTQASGARSRPTHDGRLARNRPPRRAPRGGSAPARRWLPLRRRPPGLAARASLRGYECSPGARAPSRTEPRGSREPQPGRGPEQQPQRSSHGSSSARRPPGDMGQSCLQGVQAGSRDRSFHG
jgi:hypothetical protein